MSLVYPTYSESKGRSPFDWNAFLNRKEITDEAWRSAEKLASDWVTCACGNQCDVIPRSVDGEPFDITLSSYGMEFYYAISGRDTDDVKLVLGKIEARSITLIKKFIEELEK